MAYKDPNDPRKTNAARLLKDNEYAEHGTRVCDSNLFREGLNLVY
jgi:hypothetical protein